MSRALLPLALVAAVLAAAPARAFDPAEFALRPHPGAALPLDVSVRDEQGMAVVLRQYFTGAPIILILEYLRCRTLCGVALQNVIGALDALPFEPGNGFQLVAVSIDPRDTPADAAAAKAKYLAGDRRPGAERGVHFLTGDGQAAQRLAAAVGFPYRYDAALDQYIHPAGFVVATPDGRIARYFFGAGPIPGELAGALAQAVQNKAAGPLTQLLVLCHLGGAAAGRRTAPVLAAFTLADAAAMAALVVVFLGIRRRRHG